MRHSRLYFGVVVVMAVAVAAAATTVVIVVVVNSIFYGYLGVVLIVYRSHSISLIIHYIHQ